MHLNHSKFGFPWIVVLVPVFVMCSILGAIYWFESRGVQVPDLSGVEAAPMSAITLDPFVVNLADENGTRFIRTTVSIIMPEHYAHGLDESAVNKARVRSMILEVLAKQTADQLITPEGKAKLKVDIADVAEGLPGLPRVLVAEDILFSEFVVQF